MAIKKDFQKLIHKLKNFLLQKTYYAFKKEYFKQNYSETKRLILFFVPDGTDRINGGILSICTIYNVIKELKNIHDCDVIASFLPNKKETDYKYRTFSNEMIIYTFKEIEAYSPNLDFAEIHIPDVMISKFNRENKEMVSFFNWTKKIKEVKINFLNQNDLFMPPIEKINDFKKLFTNITMTVAHQKYASDERRNYYNVPLHLFSAWLNPTPYVVRDFSEKENLIIYSPDKIQWIPNATTLTKEKVLANLKSKLPEYRFLEIKNMKYDVYKEYASKAKFAITFGEGLDAYFTEPIISGGISFAVYNKFFFTKDFENMPSLYTSFDELNEKIAEDIKRYDSPENYKQYNDYQIKIVKSLYSFDKVKNNIKQYYLNNLDFK
jgi:hypothetical protein